MPDRSRKPILVSGAHRSGSTWVGKMLALPPEVVYVHEPFHLKYQPGICGARFDYWYTYLTEDNAAAVEKDLRKMFGFQYRLGKALWMCRRPYDVKKVLDERRTFQEHRRAGRRFLMKDPIALFSAEWLAQTFDMEVVILIRHPAAFAGSLKFRDWQHPFSHFLAQPLLMHQLLGPFEEEIRAHAETEHDIIDQAILLWKIIYGTIAHYREQHADWVYLRHEDLSAAPVAGFEQLYARLGLDFSEDIKGVIQEHSSTKNPKASSESVGNIHLDSRANIKSWKKRLSETEIRRIREGVEPWSRAFYKEEDW